MIKMTLKQKKWYRVFQIFFMFCASWWDSSIQLYYTLGVVLNFLWSSRGGGMMAL